MATSGKLTSSSKERGVRSEGQPLEGKQHGSDSYSLAANALTPIVQEMGAATSYQRPVTSFHSPRRGLRRAANVGEASSPTLAACEDTSPTSRNRPLHHSPRTTQLLLKMTTKLVSYSNSQPKSKLWMAAIKPPMYSVAIIPIWVGTAVAVAETKILNAGIFSTFLTAAICIVAWSNISNDVFDSETGIDKNKAHSLVNLTGNKPLIFWIGNLFLALGLLGILAIAWWQRDLTVIGIILMCCALGYAYQGPPFRLGYHGLGEILCFIAYGPLAVSAAYYSQTQSWSKTNIAASIIIGIVTSLILFCSHFHQVKDDLAAGKRSPIVRLGTALSANLLPWICGGIYAFTSFCVILGVFPTWTLLSWLSLPFAIKLCHHVLEYHDQPEKVSNCKFIAVGLHFISGLFLGLGFML